MACGVGFGVLRGEERYFPKKFAFARASGKDHIEEYDGRGDLFSYLLAIMLFLHWHRG